MQIAIDGPSGSGKSTIAKILAKTLGIVYVNTGALYRAVGFHAQNVGASLDDEAALVAAMDLLNLRIQYLDGVQHIYANEQDVTTAIRTAQAGMAASDVARFEGIRLRVVNVIQGLASEQSVIMDGRDIGTVVLPRADVKIFLTASVEARAARRVGELEQLGQTADFDDIAKQIATRDEQDTSRAASPLKQADDAVLLDTTALNIEETIEAILAIIKNKGLI